MSYAINLAESKIFNFLRHQKLSSQISLTYAVVLLATIILMNIATTAGVYYLFHHQASRAIEISVEQTTDKISYFDSVDEKFLAFGTLMSGVILRVTDEQNKTVLDSSPSFPTLEKILQFERKVSPFWASEDYKFIETPNSFFYYKNLPMTIGGKNFNFHFLKTITFEKNLIRYTLWVLLIVDLIGLCFAIKFGYFLSKRILKPLSLVTSTAKEISAGNLDKRLEVKNFGDEVGELSDSFNKMLERLEESFKQQQRFIADASHEFRTPITVIRGYVDMLESYGVEDKELFDEATTEIKKSATNMQTLIESLLFLARADQNNLPLKKSPVEVNKLLQNVVESFHSQRIEFIAGENFEILGDENFLRKMFSEFVENALNFSEDKIIVEFKNSVVKIIDKGIGIAEENRDKIFDRFFLADKSRTKKDIKNFSAGLGLSIAKWIADSHGIKIEVESELNKGTTIKCFLQKN